MTRWILLSVPATLLAVATAAAAVEFVAVGMSGTVTTSPDGITWTSQSVGGEDLWDIVYDGTQFVAVGNQGTIITSPDGATWTFQATPTTERLRGIGANATHLVVVSLDGTILRSPDGVSWSGVPSPTTAFLRDVAYGNGVWVAVGNQGARATSVDGINWVAAPHPDESWVVAFGEGLFATGNDNGDVTTSPDGSSWTTQATPTGNRLRGIAHNGADFVVAGLDDTIITSPDGLTWTNQATPTSQHLRAAAFDGNTWVVVGELGTLITSTDTVAWTARSSGTSVRLAGAAASYWPDAASSSLAASPTAITADGTATSTLTLTLRADNGAAMLGGGHTVTFSTDLGAVTPAVDNGDGTYTTTLTCTTLGTATVEADVYGGTVSATVECEPGAADAGSSTIGASASTLIADGAATATVTVTLHDSDGHALDAGGDTVAITSDLGSMGAVTDNGDGTYEAVLTAGTVLGTANVQGSVNGDGIGSVAIDLVPGPAAVATIAATPSTLFADGAATATVTVTLFDAYGHALPSGGDAVSLSASTGSLGAVTSNGDGSYRATYTAGTVAGTASISVTFNDNAGPSASIQLVPGAADPAMATIEAAPTLLAIGDESIVTVTMRDAHGNAVATGGHAVSVTTDLGTVGAVADNMDGTYTATATASDTGTATLQAFVGGDPGPTVQVEFLATLVDGAASSMAFADAEVLAGEETTLTIVVVGVDGQPMVGLAPVAVVDDGALGPFTDHGGTYTATWTAPGVGGVVVATATVDGVTIAPVHATVLPDAAFLVDVDQQTVTVTGGPGPGHLWSFGSGTAEGATATHRYATGGLYTITHYVEQGGVLAVAEQQVRVPFPPGPFDPFPYGGTHVPLRPDAPAEPEQPPEQPREQPAPPNAAPTAAAGPDVEQTGGRLIYLDGGGSFDPDGQDLLFTWQQVDGPVVDLHDAGHKRAWFLAPDEGTLTFRLEVSDGAAADQDEVAVHLTAPATSVPWSVDVKGATAHFDVDAPAGATVHWEFGDGTASSALEPSHTYQAPGSYVVRLVVTAGGETHEAVRVVVVDEAPPAVEQSTQEVPPQDEPELVWAALAVTGLAVAVVAVLVLRR